MQSNEDIYIGKTVQREAFDEKVGKCPRYNHSILQNLKKLLDDIAIYGELKAADNISEEKVRYFVNHALNYPNISDFKHRVQMAHAAFKIIYTKRLSDARTKINCLPDIVGNEKNRKVHSDIIQIFKQNTSKPNWDDAEVLVEAHEAGLKYKDLIFVTGDVKDILCNKDALLSCTSLHDIKSLFEC